MSTPTDSMDAVAYGSGWLAGLGPTSWAEVVRLFGGWSAFWQAADGAQLGTVPDELPWATHLWCWDASGLLARVRVDARCHIAVLADDQETLIGIGLSDHEPVDYTWIRSDSDPQEQDTFLLWEQNDRVRRRPSELFSRRWEQRVTLAETPITFVRIAPVDST